MKVYELSKELNIENKELLKILSELEIEAKSHLSVLDDEQVEIVKNTVANNTNNIKENNVQEVKVEKPKKDKFVWKPDLQRMICLKNIARGKLVYKSKRQMGYTIEWDKKGDTNYIELGEFISLKNTDKRFVTEPWVRIIEDDEIEILQYANIFQYYKEILGIENVSDILRLDFQSFKKKFDKLPEGYKNAVVEYAADMIKNGELDSIKIKNYIEETMGIELDILTRLEGKKKTDTINIK